MSFAVHIHDCWFNRREKNEKKAAHSQSIKEKISYAARLFCKTLFDFVRINPWTEFDTLSSEQCKWSAAKKNQDKFNLLFCYVVYFFILSLVFCCDEHQVSILIQCFHNFCVFVYCFIFKPCQPMHTFSQNWVFVYLFIIIFFRITRQPRYRLRRLYLIFIVLSINETNATVKTIKQSKTRNYELNANLWLQFM